MLKIFEGRWKIVVMIAAPFLVLAGINITITQAILDLSPLPIERTSGSPLSESKDTPSLPDFGRFELPQTLEKPIFSPMRRDFIEAVQIEEPSEVADDKVVETPALEPVLELPPMRLRGIRLSREKRSALIAVGESAAEWIGEGEEIAGWTVRSVTVDGVSLAVGSQSAAFSLYDVGKAGGADE